MRKINRKSESLSLLCVQSTNSILKPGHSPLKTQTLFIYILFAFQYSNLSFFTQIGIEGWLEYEGEREKKNAIKIIAKLAVFHNFQFTHA